MPAPSLHVSSSLRAADHLRLDGISRSFPDRRVLTDVSLTVTAGEVACLIGENGSGKSTLLRVAAGLDAPDAGTVSVPGTVGLFHQEPPFARVLTIRQVLADATAPVRRLAHDVERESEALAGGDADAADRLAVALEAAERHHAWDLEHRVERVVDALGIAALPRDRRAGQCSGGEEARLSLAWLLLRSPDTLLLDEPTNHLDDQATALLVEWLGTWSGPVLLASHDRAFLDDVATTLVDLDPAPRAFAEVAHDPDSPGSGFGLTRFTGTYTAYLEHQRAERERWERRHRDEQAELRRLRARVRDDHVVGHPDRGPRSESRASRKFYADRNARVVARRVNDAATALERLEREQVRKPPPVLHFRGLGRLRPRADSGPVLTVSAATVRGRLAPVSVSLAASGRLLVTGANGSGKSTLLAVLAGRLRPDAGAPVRRPGLRVALLAQEPVVPDAGLTARQAYATAVGEELAERVPLASLGLLPGRDLDRPVRALSVGQRRRLDLAVVAADPPDVLLLDEPTNHLSLLLVAELEAGLTGYAGAVVVASHDRRLREGWVGPRLELAPPGEHSASAGGRYS